MQPARKEKTVFRKNLTASRIVAFQKRILEHYRCHGRSLPWRSTRNPYHILVSEIMLQQTQVDRVISKYNRFIRLFPDVTALARAPLQEVLAAWSGLGYNRRAIALKKCAEALDSGDTKALPRTYEELLQLPGIGPYTASAVCAFAYNLPRVFIETNIRTVYIHFFFAGQGRVSDTDILPLLEQTLYKKDPRTWYNALMDYGVLLKQQFENPARRSAHYTRQSAFKGSDREIRGMLLRALLQLAPCSEARLIRATGKDPARAKALLHALVQEGFMKKKDRLLSPA
jgi:A/G-specific adenine glycosylase